MITAGLVSSLAAWVLATFNFVVMLCCLLLFSISLWMISSPSTLSAAIQQFGSPTLDAILPLQVLTVQNGVGTAAIAVFLFIISFMGFYGAVSRSQFLLFMYSTLVMLMLLLECALTFYFSSNLIEKGLQDDGQWSHALRLLFQCCDVKNTTQDTLKPPWSCCGPDFYPENCTLAEVFQKDCQTAISSWIDRYITVVYTSLAVLHLVLSSCSLIRRSRCASHSHS